MNFVVNSKYLGVSVSVNFLEIYPKPNLVVIETKIWDSIPNSEIINETGNICLFIYLFINKQNSNHFVKSCKTAEIIL